MSLEGLALHVSLEGLALHADWVVKDVQYHDCAKEFEVGEVETITKLEVSQLRPSGTGPGSIEDHLLFRITR